MHIKNKLTQIPDFYEELNKSEVFLEEENHIYIHKKTGKFFNSVTGVISQFSNEFNEKGVISGLRQQYNNFYTWFFNIQKGNPEEFIAALSKYVNYCQFTDKETAIWQGQEYQRYVKKITDYNSIEEFLTEYLYLEEIYSNRIKRLKNIYIGPDVQIMSASDISGMWKDMTNIANHYGNMVHLILERFLLKKQGVLDDGILLGSISTHYFWIRQHLPIFYDKYPYSTHSFEEYELDLALNDLIIDVETEFEKLSIPLGMYTIPERRLLYRNLAGTKDVDTHLDLVFFNTGDHKTNKDLSKESHFNEKMKPPFDSYEDSHLNHYTFQLSTYSLMQERSVGKKLKDQYITYYNRKRGKFEVFPIEYKKEEADFLINYYDEWIEERKKRYLSSSLGHYIREKIKPEWMDHFAKNFYYCIAENKDKDKGKNFYIEYINNYVEKHKNIKYTA